MATKRAEVAEQQYEDALKQINSLKDALFNYEVDQNLHGSENSVRITFHSGYGVAEIIGHCGRCDI